MSEPLSTELQLREALRLVSPARVGLARSGDAIGSRDELEFRLDHALARDAVHARLDLAHMLAGLRERGLAAVALESAVCDAHTKTDERRTYLRRPDLGRRLSVASRKALDELADDGGSVNFILADGLSALAVERHALPLLDATLPLLPAGWRVGLAAVATQARVALGDEVGAVLRSRMTVMLIGERPGLSAADSLGVYLTLNPRLGRTDAERNCISNVRGGGLGYEEAAQRIVAIMEGARQLGETGVGLRVQDRLPGKAITNAEDPR